MKKFFWKARIRLQERALSFFLALTRNEIKVREKQLGQNFWSDSDRESIRECLNRERRLELELETKIAELRRKIGSEKPSKGQARAASA